MSVEQTLSIIKPDGVEKNLIGEIYGRFEKAGLTIVAAKMLHLSQADAEGFYAVHKERPFFNDLVQYMTSGPVMVQVLEGADAVSKNREIMGATNPADAAPGTIRADYAASIERTLCTVRMRRRRPRSRSRFSSATKVFARARGNAHERGRRKRESHRHAEGRARGVLRWPWRKTLSRTPGAAVDSPATGVRIRRDDRSVTQIARAACRRRMYRTAAGLARIGIGRWHGEVVVRIRRGSGHRVRVHP